MVAPGDGGGMRKTGNRCTISYGIWIHKPTHVMKLHGDTPADHTFHAMKRTEI